MYRSNKGEGKFSRDSTNEEHEKCNKDIIVLDNSDCIKKMMSWLSEMRRKLRKVKNRNVEYILQLIAHIGQGFDILVVLNFLSNMYRFVNFIKNGKGFTSLKVYTRNVKMSEKKLQSITFRCGMTHIISGLKTGFYIWFTKRVFLEKDQDEVFEDTWKDKKDVWLEYVKSNVLCTAFSYARYSKRMQVFTGFGMKSGLTLPNL